MGRLWTRSADCEYNEYNWRLNEQFIHGLDNKSMICEILREISALEDTDDTTSEWLLKWALRLEAQEVKKVLNNIREAKESDSSR